MSIVSLESNEPTGGIKSFRKPKMTLFDSAWVPVLMSTLWRYILEMHALNPVIVHTFCVPGKTADKLIPVLSQDFLKPDFSKLCLQTDSVLHCDSHTCVAKSQDKYSHHMHYHKFICFNLISNLQL